MSPPVALGINGFGRIGRLVLRAALDHPDATVVAINDPFLTLEYAAYLLQHDSVHGTIDKEVKVVDDKLMVGDVEIHFFGERNPAGTCAKNDSKKKTRLDTLESLTPSPFSSRHSLGHCRCRYRVRIDRCLYHHRQGVGTHQGWCIPCCHFGSLQGRTHVCHGCQSY